MGSVASVGAAMAVIFDAQDGAPTQGPMKAPGPANRATAGSQERPGDQSLEAPCPSPTPCLLSFLPLFSR